MAPLKSRILRYVYAIATVVLAVAIRMAVTPWTGKGAPFVLFFGAVLISAFLWGVGPGLLAGIVATPVAAYLFVYEAGYSVDQTIAQSTIFVLEISAICILASRFSAAKRGSEAATREAERAASHALRAEAELQRVAFELNEAQRLANVGSWSCDGSGGDMSWSEGMYRLFSWSRDKSPPTYTEYPNMYSPRTAEPLRAASQLILREGRPYELELEHLRPDGSRQFLIGRAEALRDSSGAIVRIRGMVNDVTLLKELQRSREEWTSVIAHDLRQPIAVIGMCVEALPRLHASKSIEKESRTWERMGAEVRSLARMVDDLLDVSRMDAKKLTLERAWIDPRMLVDGSLERLAYLTRGFQVEVTEGGELSPVFADPGRLEQALGNLVSNAVRYGDPGKKILIHLQGQPESVEISVANYGRGIREEERLHLFERYWRSATTRRGRVPGLGLGLYITKGIVEAHRGRISVESVPGGLTTFRVSIPASSSRRPVQAAS